MTIGFTIPATESYVTVATDIRPDKGMSRSSNARVRVAKFGDGYEQRFVDGINFIEESFSVSFSNRTKESIDDIERFFASRKGTSFDFTIPDTNNSGETTIKVVCAAFSVKYDNDKTYSCSTTFRRVYEA
jgi:phage-related protein